MVDGYDDRPRCRGSRVAQPVHRVFPGETPGPPIYANISAGFLPHTDDLAVILFYRLPAACPRTSTCSTIWTSLQPSPAARPARSCVSCRSRDGLLAQSRRSSPGAAVFIRTGRGPNLVRGVARTRGRRRGWRPHDLRAGRAAVASGWRGVVVSRDHPERRSSSNAAAVKKWSPQGRFWMAARLWSTSTRNSATAYISSRTYGSTSSRTCEINQDRAAVP